MDKRLDRREKDKIGSRVRFKSYGTFMPKGAGEGSGEEMFVRGFFTSDKMDEVGDIITKEATVDAVERWRQWGNIRTMHNNPSGRIEKIGEDDGLAWNEVVTVPVDEDTIKLIKGGVLKAYSVGIIPREYELNQEALEEAGDDVDPWFLPLIIHSYDMVEISYVDHPANYAATISEIGSEKFKDMSHRTVLFKNSEIMGDIDDMDKEKDVDALEEELDVSASEELDEQVDSEDVESVEDAGDDIEKAEEAEEADDVETEVEKEEGAEEEEEIVEKDEEETFDVALAVGEVKSSIANLEEQVSGLAESLDGLVDMVVERLVDAIALESSKSVDDDAAADEDEVDTPEEGGVGKEFDEDAFVEKVSEKVLAGLVSILSPEATRSAKVTVDGEPADNATDETSEEKTKRYLEMTPAERRARMKDVLGQSVTNNK